MTDFRDQQIESMRRQLESMARRLTYVEQQQDPHITPVFIAKTGGSGIAALSGSTPGNDTVTLYQINSSGTLETIKDDQGSDVTVTAYNMAASGAVASSAWIQIKQEMGSGKYVVDFEDCS